MNNLEIQLNELSRVESNLALVQSVVNWLRPDDVTQIQGVEEKVRRLAHAMAANPEQAAVIRTKMRTFLVKLRFLPLYSDTGILPRRGFPTEFWRRVYDKFMPEPPIIFSAKNLLDRVFDNRHDWVWIKAVSDVT
ncbi:MAG TPA: hypothetical protein PKD98_30390, partial [Anaerolineae bacterium]|nr:hypothetical protein [Anaerolineae bacterium]